MALTITPTMEARTLRVGGEILEVIDDQARTDIAAIKDELPQKADINGYYEDLTAGTSDQLNSTQYVEDSVPYLFRTTGGSADVGDRADVRAIVGGSLVWNQLVSDPLITSESAIVGARYCTAAIDGGVITATVTTAGTERGVSIRSDASRTVGHRVLISAYIKTSTSGTIAFGIAGGSFPTSRRPIVADAWTYLSGIFTTVDGVSNAHITIYQYNATAVGDTIQIKLPIAFDLTAMFGSTIADYIYSLEQASAGAGVDWFRKLFPADYYPYSANIFKHVEGLSAHNTVEFNAYDPATGTAKLVGGMAYEVTGTYTALTFEGETVTLTNKQFTPSKNGILTVTGGNSTNTCVHLVWSGWMNGVFMPYVKHSYPLDSSVILRGIPKLDSQNNLYYDGDRYLPDGTVERRYGIVDLGTLNWSYDASSTRFYTTAVPVLATTTTNYKINAQCTALLADEYRYLNNGTKGKDKIMGAIVSGNTTYFAVTYSNYTNVATFKTAMSGVYLVYELATPTTETADPYQETQIVNDFGTEEYVSTDIVPVGHETRYPANLRDKLQHLPDLAVSDGYYMISQSGHQMTLEHFRIPKAPTEDGTYTLKATVSGGTPTYTWVEEATE